MKKFVLYFVLVAMLTVTFSANVSASSTSGVVQKSGLTLNVNESDNFIPLTEEEFIARKAEITGEPVTQVRRETINNKVGILSDPVQTVYREYFMLISLGGNIVAKAGVLTIVNQFTFGHSVYYRFKEVVPDTTYLNSYSGGTFTIVKNYAATILENDRNILIAASGYAETAVVNGTSQGLNLTGGQLVSIGWSVQTSSSSTTYYRRHFNDSTRVTLS